MRSLTRPILLAARNSHLRTMSSLARGHILAGTYWDYSIIGAVSGDNTHTSIAFKAEIIPRENTLDTPRWFIVLR